MNSFNGIPGGIESYKKRKVEVYTCKTEEDLEWKSASSNKRKEKEALYLCSRGSC